MSSWGMRFYQETNLLADVELVGFGVLVFKGHWYEDDSGVLSRLSSELDDQMKTWPNNALQPTATAPSVSTNR
jgi:hypothetical protein